MHTHTHPHIKTHNTHIQTHDTYITPTHTLRVSHITDASTARGAGFTLPACSVPIQKLIHLCWDSKSLSSHLHRGGAGEQGRTGEGKKGGGGGSSGEMTSPSLKCHHYLKPRLSYLQRWHHPVFAPPPSVLSKVVWWGSVFVCVQVQGWLES